MVLLANFISALGFLFPVLVFVGLRSSRARKLWQIALDIPVAVSLDLLVVLTLTLVMRLEVATLVSRAGYLVVAGGVLARRGRPFWRWPEAIGRRELLRLGVAAAVGLDTSLWMSRTWMIWDRGWHIPLAGSLRGQSLPFRNVFNADEVLHYHFSGDVQAAMLQTLSGGVLHSSLALSLLHDVHFTLAALALGLFMTGWGYRTVAELALGPALLLLTGPVHLFRGHVRTPQEGYSFVSYLSFSFQPHAALGGLLILGFVGAVVVRLGERDDLPFRATAPALCACAAGLAITDETSLGMLGLTLGLTWLSAPRVLHARRWAGVLVFGLLVAALVVPNLAFSASFSPGTEHHVLRLVPWRAPGYYRAALPLSTPVGRLMLGYDMFGPAAVALGGLVHVLRRRGRGRGVVVAFFATLLGLSLLALTRVDIDAHPSESHRFASAAFIAGPFVGIALLSRRFASPASPASRSPYTALGMLTGMAAAAVSTLDWGLYYAPTWAARQHDFGAYDFYTTSCNKAVGDRRWARARYTYVARPLYYLVTGCVPTFTPGFVSDSAWKSITIGLPREKNEAIAAIRKALPRGAPIPLVCPVGPGKPDPVCALAEASGSCKPTGLVTKDCTLSAALAAALPPK
jgi:hypothetical protein